jgi:hypothetical protein
MIPRTEHRAVGDLRPHHAAGRLLGDPALRGLFAGANVRAPVLALPDGTIVGGVAAYLHSRESRAKRIRVTRRDELVNEDPAVIAGMALKDLLGGTRDPIALGAAWLEFRNHCTAASRPRKGYPKHKYQRTHGVSPAERLAGVIRETFGYTDDQLRRFAALTKLPPELQTAYQAHEVSLRQLVDLAARPPSVAAVLRELRDGVPPAEVLSRHLPGRRDSPAPRTALRRLHRAGDKAGADLAGRVLELTYLTDAERDGVIRLHSLEGQLLALPSQEQVLREVSAALGRRDKQDRVE